MFFNKKITHANPGIWKRKRGEASIGEYLTA